MNWPGEDVMEFHLRDDGTVRITFIDGTVEVYGFWKGVWMKEEDDG